ncbi:tetratricopeptide repeat protein [Hyphomicrobium sp.]|jgi:predicted O-linked N-acetylglucosamine transferase (SPINDLY family)|uniref:O-linked N-acetylglucosamine transferase family protein n=1 Tax=Hyphomicrobium sp. TaxID=82 RepID=UPI0035662E82
MNRRERRRASAVSQPIAQRVEHPEAARHYHDAVQHLKLERFAESEVAHHRVLSLVPSHAPSLHHLGLIAFKRRELNGAVDFIRQSLSVQPDYHEAWLNLAIILTEMKRSQEAIEACRECLALQPRHAEAHAVLGNLLRLVDGDEAMKAYSNSLALKPDQPLVLTRLGELRLKSGDVDAAAAHCRRALELDPNLDDARNLDRRLLAATSRSIATLAAEIEAQSKTASERARRFDQLATYFRDERRLPEAADMGRRAVAADPGVADYHLNLALTLEGLGFNEDALKSYQAGLAIEPDRAEAYASVGTLLRNMNMHNGAIQALEHAVKLKPDLATAHYELAITYKLRDRFDEACTAFQKSIECAPDSVVNRFEYINLRRTLCDWDGVDAEERVCLQIFRSKTARIAPFQLISLWSSPSDQLRAAKEYAKTFDVPQSLRLATNQNLRRSEQRIRIGFLSCDFFEHATAMLFAEVLEKLDRSRFEIFGYCHSPEDNSAMRQRMLRAFDHTRKIATTTNREAAAMIHDDSLDVLVDLKGYTRDARTEILAYRPAPIQVNYLGYPGTMGADFIDYIVADAVVAPMEMQANYSERIVHLPNSYQPNDRQRVISDEPVTRAEYGLPEDAFVFCSFNNSYKLNTTMFDLWMPLLRKVPGSVLWLLVPNATCASNLRRESEARGVDPSRLVFAERASTAKHLARHRLADLFLDALPCNAHTTTSDALWAGLPVLTCLGETFAGRVAGSLLTAMGLPELIASSLDDYRVRALELAHDREKLDAIRRKLINQRETAPLFDSTRYTRNLERSFETMVEIMRAGEVPRPFVVVETDPPRSAPPPTASTTSPVLRAAFDGCPICDSRETSLESEARITNHMLYNTILPPVLKWRRCTSCDHVFTEGYLTPAGAAIIHSAIKAETSVGKDAENSRKTSAKMVSRVARFVPDGDWLDIGFGNASRVFTASEWGFRAVGIDANEGSVAKLRKFGYEAYRDLDEISGAGRFSVVSMIDVLDRTPFPSHMLAAVQRVMRPGGALVLSMANTESIVWRALDATGANPYWSELERYHNFTRARLVGLLSAHGFKFAEYDIAEDHRSGMEVVALKMPAD